MRSMWSLSHRRHLGKHGRLRKKGWREQVPSYVKSTGRQLGVTRGVTPCQITPDVLDLSLLILLKIAQSN